MCLVFFPSLIEPTASSLLGNSDGRKAQSFLEPNWTSLLTRFKNDFKKISNVQVVLALRVAGTTGVQADRSLFAKETERERESKRLHNRVMGF